MNKATIYPVSARGPADHEVRDQIVAAATEHFSRYGYEKTTVSDLAKAIGFSKAYIYKFFESKQAIGEMICANCLREIEAEVSAAIAGADTPPEKLRRMFKALTEACLRLFFQDRKLYEIAASAATERWQAVHAYEEGIQKLLQDVLQEGRQTGDFERKTPWTRRRWPSIWSCAPTSTPYSCSTALTTTKRRRRIWLAWCSAVFHLD